MDSLAEPPVKKRCIMRDGSKIQLMECVREFRLPQQFPSTLKQAMEQGIVNTMESPSLMMPKNMKMLSDVEHQVPYKPQKLRIISANGKDLGEFNMQLRTDDPLKGQTIMITKNTPKPDKKPVSVVLSPTSQNRMLPRILKQGTARVPKNLIDFKSCNKNNFETNKINILQQSTNLPINKRLIIKNQDAKTRNKEAHACNSNIKVEIPISTNGTNSKQFMHESINNNSQNHIVHNGKSNVYSHEKIPQITVTEDETSAEEVFHKEIIELPFSIVNCKKLVLNSNNSNDMHRSEDYIKVSKRKYITSMKNTQNEKIITVLKNAINFAHKYNQINSNLSKNNLDSNSKENINNRKILNKNNSFQINSDVGFINNQVYKTMQKNVMTVIPNNETFLFNQNAISTPYNSAESSVSEKNGINVHHSKITSRHDTKGENMQNKYLLKNGFENDCSVAIDNSVQCIAESQQITNTVDSIKQLDEQNKDYTKDSTEVGLSDQLNIIKKAMDSVKDDKLRALALKALEECGIGIERYVPISIKHKAVNDTQVQTMVFGLLEPQSFVFINEDLDSIQRINQITFCDVSSNQDQLLTNSSHSNSLFKAPIIEQENDFDIDNFLQEVMEENLDAMKMKETLSVTKIRCKNLLEHLKRDFESVKCYDQNGMLNIHNAIISNNIHFVQRQLMILEQCKESVDIMTEDEMTSLELAVKYDIHSEIVKLLLTAGAQPVILKCVHESALIIASKQSSPLLSMLINYVSDSKLLDQIDSEGLAALHYCSMRDNLQGVKALISAGATVDLKDMRSGRTPLFHALDNGHKAVTQTLLKAGAITNITNYAGQTPIPVVPEKVFKNLS